MSAILKKSILFGISPSHWIPLFVTDAVFFSVLAAIFIVNPPFISFIATGSPAGVSILLGAFMLGVMWFLIRLWVSGAMIHQSYKEKEYEKSWYISWKKYPSLLGSIILIVIGGILLGLPPIINSFASIAWGMVTFFVLQSVLVKKKSSIEALRDSYAIFKKNLEPVAFDEIKFLVWFVLIAFCGFLISAARFSLGIVPGIHLWVTFAGVLFLLFYSKIARFWLLVAVISALMVIPFALPAVVIAFSSVTPDILFASQGSYPSAMLSAMILQPHLLLIVGLIFLIGSSLAAAFTLKAQTEYYLRLKKRFFGLL